MLNTEMIRELEAYLRNFDVENDLVGGVYRWNYKFGRSCALGISYELHGGAGVYGLSLAADRAIFIGVADRLLKSMDEVTPQEVADVIREVVPEAFQ